MNNGGTYADYLANVRAQEQRDRDRFMGWHPAPLIVTHALYIDGEFVAQVAKEDFKLEFGQARDGLAMVGTVSVRTANGWRPIPMPCNVSIDTARRTMEVTTGVPQ